MRRHPISLRCIISHVKIDRPTIGFAEISQEVVSKSEKSLRLRVERGRTSAPFSDATWKCCERSALWHDFLSTRDEQSGQPRCTYQDKAGHKRQANTRLQRFL